MRSTENPALDVARLLAVDLGLPLVIYQGLSETYRHASDRHHQFILEGVRDLQRDFESSSLDYLFHLERPEDRRPHLRRLGEQAAMVVVEDFPTSPPATFLRAFARQTQATILAVDTACLVPPIQLEKYHDRAYSFRDATSKLYAQRVKNAWPVLDVSPRRLDRSSIDWQPLQLAEHSLEDLIAQCHIDHSVPPVRQSIGGSTAGYERWNQFLKSGLPAYASRRNDPMRSGTSRLSPYLHYGMVSPFRIAREAAELPGTGPEKFLDELLIWRELAYHFCFHHPDHAHWSALPAWARDTLTEHAGDPRPEVYSWEQLSRGMTNDPFWNACQRTLLQTGELHNNLRMTWGKAVLAWTRQPQEALRLLIDLNNRYALDGRDPSSYGGILWCFGLFDRPFHPEQKILGLIRPRTTMEHSRRIPIRDYERRFLNRVNPSDSRVAVIGAGISGLIAARTLADHGIATTIFEKSRGVGGRMATRRYENSAFDHGAQYFTARTPVFQTHVAAWTGQGLVQRWPDPGRIPIQKIVVIRNGKTERISDSVVRHVPVPGMNSLAKHLAEGLKVELSTQVSQIQRHPEGLELFTDKGDSLGTFERLIVAVPAGQAATLLAGVSRLSEELSRIRMLPCWACLASFDAPLGSDWAGAFIHDSFLSWVARNSTKPGRDTAPENLVLHSRSDWAAAHWDQDPRMVADGMLSEFWRALSTAPRQSVHVDVHRWKYAIAEEGDPRQCYEDPEAGVVACGDWAGGSRVEGAFLSGLAAFGRTYAKTCPPSARPLRQQELFS